MKWKTLRIGLLLSLFLLLSWHEGVFAYLFPRPERFAHEGAGVRALSPKTGEVRWTAHFDNRLSGNQWVIHEEGEGVRSPHAGETSWTGEVVLSFQDVMRPVSFRKEVHRKGGALIEIETRSFDFTKKNIHVVRKDGSGKITLEKNFSLPEDIVVGEAVGIPLRAFPFKKQREISFHMITPQLQIYKITAKQLKKETVKTSAGMFEAYKIELIPDIGPLGGLLGGFIPKTYLWQTVAPPHYWVKYQGLEGGRNTPEIIMELTDLDYHN